MDHWSSAPDCIPKVPGSNPASPQPMADCHLQVGCHKRWDYLAIGCPLGGDRGKEKDLRSTHKKIVLESNCNEYSGRRVHI